MNLNEGLKVGDLARLIDPELHIDEYKSKMGDDEDIVVISFKITGKEPGLDLVNFIENGYDFVLDADLSPGEFTEGEHLVFVELERRLAAPEQIFKLVTEVLNLTEQDINEWTFKFEKDETIHKFTLEALTMVIPESPKEYRDTVDTEDDEVSDLALENMKQAAGIPSGKIAPMDEEMEAVRIAAGIR